MASCKKWITFNVGGTYFMTSRTTILKSTPTNSPLYRTITNSTNVIWDRDERGAYMIDRDPDYFRTLLNYLRTGQLVMSRDTPEEAILLEAEYFVLPELIKLVHERQAGKLRSYRNQLPDFALQALTNQHPFQQPILDRATQQRQQATSCSYEAQISRAKRYQQPYLATTIAAICGGQNGANGCALSSGNDSLKADSLNNMNQLSSNSGFQQLKLPITSSDSTSSLNSLLNQQDYLTSFVNNVVDEEIS